MSFLATMAGSDVFTFGLFGMIVLAFALLGVIVWAWGAFLDVHEHNPGRVRAVMVVILGVATICELGFTFCALTYPWVAVVSLLVNLWGGLDALLRFPAAHDIESFFAVKQFLLLLCKTFGYAFGINNFRMHVGKFLLVLLINIWGLPVLYLMALPLDPAEQVAADDRDDVDLIMRMWHIAIYKDERQRCMKTCRSWWHRRLFAISEKSPIAKIAICASSPAYRKKFSKGIRSI